MNCGFCFKALDAVTLQNIGFRAECPFCHEDLHSCVNCEFYDPKVYNECKETSADVVREKKRANFCDFFKYKSSGFQASDKTKDLRAAADALFKKK